MAQGKVVEWRQALAPRHARGSLLSALKPLSDEEEHYANPYSRRFRRTS
jgi:hypothetical protein